MHDTDAPQLAPGGCPGRVRRRDDPRVKVCHPDACRGRIVPLLLEMCRNVGSPAGLSAALDAVLAYMRRDMGVVRAMINLRDQETGCTFIHRSLGLTPAEEGRGVYFPGEGITGQVDSLAQTVIVPRIGDEPTFLNRTGSVTLAEDLGRAFLCVPILRGRKVLGSISAILPFDDQLAMRKRAEALSVIAGMLAQAVELHQFEHVDKVKWEQRHQELMDAIRVRFKPANIIGSSARMMAVFALVHKVARARTTVLLLGESGVGKELITSAIHDEGPDPAGPLVKVNCAALPESLIESEIFGHEKGAFTGADQQRRGRFEEADGGTLFLDEVGELSPGAQAKLLRVLQDKTFERVGGNKPIKVGVRIVAATNRDLADMAAAGTFREDLYFRLSVFPITIPPLRERDGDIIPLAEHFMAHFAAEAEKRVTRITTPALSLLMAYSWPGNVRELENAIERAVLLTEDDAVHGYHLPPELQQARAKGEPTDVDLDARLAQIEREMLDEALARTCGNASRAAQDLGLSYRSMGIRMRRHGLRYADYRSGRGGQGRHA